MNIVAKSDLNFHGKALIPVENITGVWLTSSDLARALEYSNSRAVTMIYNKYADEFTSGMTQVLEVSTTGNYRKKVRVFSLRGAHLIAMFARTPVAKEFRRWVLDILDRELVQGNVNPAFNFDMYAHNASVALGHIEFIHQAWCKELSPALRSLGSPLAIKLCDHIVAVSAITSGLSSALNKRVKKGRVH
ncbi:Bro-N domain-containing protein [Pluralibacter gergoviae]|uniref:BRO-N domain-containing protein n=1 Tax=Pluralibacter gergoviae TaxID=61647 RepID=UPI00290E2C1A|nr:Bro-N domain-containing protein [Pluralibacter gergoviae]MDU4001450.1 Bro-N domain-containing protein [Pluralibacter gergoviae]